MHTLSDKSQFQALDIKEGKHKLANGHLEIMSWITNEFGARALDFYCETRTTPKGLQQQLIHLILDTVDDIKKIHANRVNNALIAERFLKYLQSTDLDSRVSDPLKSDVFPAETNPYPKIILTYRPLKGLDGKILNEILNEDKWAVLKTYKDVSTLSMTVVFYYTDAQKKENEINGTSAKISEELQQVEKRHGFTIPSTYYFDSMESFERDYEGKWHYYWK